MAYRRLCIRLRQAVPPPSRLPVVGALVSLLLVNPLGALPADSQAPPVEIPAAQTFQEGQVVEVRTGRPVTEHAYRPQPGQTARSRTPQRVRVTPVG